MYRLRRTEISSLMCVYVCVCVCVCARVTSSGQRWQFAKGREREKGEKGAAHAPGPGVLWRLRGMVRAVMLYETACPTIEVLNAGKHP